tara:strand:- start:148 stop:402 length:255 start_codon:yes stop_codon:yes gene_type:complete
MLLKFSPQYIQFLVLVKEVAPQLGQILILFLKKLMPKNVININKTGVKNNNIKILLNKLIIELKPKKEIIKKEMTLYVTIFFCI